MSGGKNKDSELVVSVRQGKTRIALLEEGNLVDYQVDENDMEFSVGDIFLAEIRKKVPSLKSFFVNLNGSKDGFMHYDKLTSRSLTMSNFCNAVLKGENVKVSTFEIDKREKHRVEFDWGYTSDFIEEGDKILVQISKEQISTKGPRVTGRISLAGKYLILVIFDDVVSISKKISDDAKKDKMVSLLKEIKSELKLDNFGIILRTSTDNCINIEKRAEAKKILVQDLINLLNIWSNGLKTLKNASVGTKIINAENRVFTIVKNRLNTSLNAIYVDNNTLYEKLKDEFRNEYKNLNCKLKMYNGDLIPLFAYKKVDKQLKLLSNKLVSLKNGGYLVIEKTEAMNVIDVNSGTKRSESGEQEDLAVETNIAAAEEIARQIFLRDIGGIIVVDFIDMTLESNKLLVVQTMKNLLSNDKSAVILPLSRLNLMEISRQRVRPVIEVLNNELCPSCNGSGRIESSFQIVDIVEKKICFLLSETKYYKIEIFMNPLLIPFFSIGLFSKRFKWSFKYWKSITLHDDYSLGIGSFKIYSGNNIVFNSNNHVEDNEQEEEC